MSASFGDAMSYPFTVCTWDYYNSETYTQSIPIHTKPCWYDGLFAL